MKRAIVSAAFGTMHVKMASISYPPMERYAKKVGADFKPIYMRKFPERNPHLEKFQIRDILQKYDQVLWLDCDVLVSKVAPSIFEIVPPDHFAAMDEGKHGTRIKVPLELGTMCTVLGIPYPEERNFIYFNSGVFICNKSHVSFFENVPDVIPTSHGINDQTLLNVRVALSKTPFFSLEKTWNMMWVPVGFEKSNFIHFAGRHKTEAVVEDMERVGKKIL